MGQHLSLRAPLHNDVLENIVDFLTIDSIKNLKQVHPDFEKWINCRYILNVTLPVRKTDSSYKDMFRKPILQITIKESEVNEMDSEPVNKAFINKIITYKLKDLQLECTSYASANDISQEYEGTPYTHSHTRSYWNDFMRLAPYTPSERDKSSLIRKIFYSLFRKHQEKPLKHLKNLAVTLTPESDKIVTFRSIYKCMPNIVELKVSGILPLDYTKVHFPNLESFSYKLRESNYSNLTEYQRMQKQETRAEEISCLKKALLACPKLKYINQVLLEPPKAHPPGAPLLDTQLSKPKPVPLVCLDVKLPPLGDEEENPEPAKEARKMRDSSPMLPKALEEALAFKSEKAQQDGVRPEDVERVENEGQPKMALGPSMIKTNPTPSGKPTLVAEAEDDDDKGKRHKKMKKKNRPENRKQEKAEGEPDVEVEYIQETLDLDPKDTTYKTFSKIFEEKKSGDLSDDLRTALGMPVGPIANKVPPPWLIAMQRYGPPPSYPNLKIMGLNAPIPDGCSFGYHAGGWGKPTVDEQGKPLYGDVFGPADVNAYHQPVPEEINRTLWGEMEIESEEEEEEETRLQEKRNERVGASMMGSTHTYDLVQKKSRASDTAIELALNPKEVDLMDSDTMHLQAKAAMRLQQTSLAKENLSGMVAEHAAKQRSKRKRLEKKDEKGSTGSPI